MSKPFQAAIMGAGPGGSYLYRLLRQRKPEIEVTIFDKPQPAACGIKPCGWGVSWRNFARLCRLADIDPDKYVTGRYEYIIAWHFKVKADIAIVNKALFLNDMLSGTEPLSPDKADLTCFDRIVDATGVRAYLPEPLSGPFVETIQIKTKVKSVTCPVVSPHMDGGYSWLFPIGDTQAHLGSLSSTGIDNAVNRIKGLKHDFTSGEVMCSCKARIWRGGPVLPFIDGKVWGLGESIGLVDPVPGAGIVSAMDSARIMAENWSDAESYRKQIRRQYGYMSKEARITANLAAGVKPAIRDLLLPPRAFRNVGVEPTLRQIIRITAASRKQSEP